MSVIVRGAMGEPLMNLLEQVHLVGLCAYARVTTRLASAKKLNNFELN